MSDVNLCLEVFMYKKIRKTLNRISEIIMNKSNTSRNITHIYYLVLKWFIYQIGKDCDNKRCSVLPLNFEDFNFDQLIQDVKNTIDYDLKEEDIKEYIFKAIKKRHDQMSSRVNKKHISNIFYDRYNKSLVFNCQDCEIDNYKIDLIPELRDKLKNTYLPKDNNFYHNIFAILLRYELFG